MINDWYGTTSMYAAFLYPYFLYIMVLLKQRTQPAKSTSKGEST